LSRMVKGWGWMFLERMEVGGYTVVLVVGWQERGGWGWILRFVESTISKWRSCSPGCLNHFSLRLISVYINSSATISPLRPGSSISFQRFLCPST
jgi:hypothetical protein